MRRFLLVLGVFTVLLVGFSLVRALRHGAAPAVAEPAPHITVDNYEAAIRIYRQLIVNTAGS